MILDSFSRCSVFWSRYSLLYLGSCCWDNRPYQVFLKISSLLSGEVSVICSPRHNVGFSVCGKILRNLFVYLWRKCQAVGILHQNRSKYFSCSGKDCDQIFKVTILGKKFVLVLLYRAVIIFRCLFWGWPLKYCPQCVCAVSTSSGAVMHHAVLCHEPKGFCLETFELNPCISTSIHMWGLIQKSFLSGLCTSKGIAGVFTVLPLIKQHSDLITYLVLTWGGNIHDNHLRK